MNKQSGMTPLEALLVMSIFTTVMLTLMSSTQGQWTAAGWVRDGTLVLWIAGNQLRPQDSFDEENTSSFGRGLINGEELMNGEEWSWRSDIHSNRDGAFLEHIVMVTLPSGQTTSFTRYQGINNKFG